MRKSKPDDKVIKFEAQIKKVEIKSLVSLDKGIGILLYTDDIKAIDLALIPADKTIRVNIVKQ